MIIQPIINIAEICAQHGISQAVICPGSRSALLTLAFSRHPKIETFTIPDERSAGFIALGLAQSSKKPVAVITTSGTATANLYPSIIEAFYQHVPLLVLTADRPPEWIDQLDGQTIRQDGIYAKHAVESFQFPVSFDHPEAVWHAEKMISEAIILTQKTTKGPVHINIPVREPFYPAPDENFHYSKSIRVVQSDQLKMDLSTQDTELIIDQLEKYEKVMILAGQAEYNELIVNSLNMLQSSLKWVVVGDVIANIQQVKHAIRHHDILLNSRFDTPDLIPDLLITFGQSTLSKKLKTFIRENTPKAHWHVGENEALVDPFKSISKKFILDPGQFLKVISEKPLVGRKTQNKYFNLWKEKELRAKEFLENFMSHNTFSEFHAVNQVVKHLPDESTIHLANSMPVRYANYIHLDINKKNEVWANRGTSGIDGCTSTSLGHALNSKKINTLISGDMAFFYDRNALWHNHLPHNLRIIILNNHGGGIFRLINGPKQLPELSEYFETNQKLNAANTARDFGMKYYIVKTLEALPGFLEEFFDVDAGPSILEIECDSQLNQKVFEDFIKKSSELWL